MARCYSQGGEGLPGLAVVLPPPVVRVDAAVADAADGVMLPEEQRPVVVRQGDAR